MWLYKGCNKFNVPKSTFERPFKNKENQALDNLNPLKSRKLTFEKKNCSDLKSQIIWEITAINFWYFQQLNFSRSHCSLSRNKQNRSTKKIIKKRGKAAILLSTAYRYNLVKSYSKKNRQSKKKMHKS